LTTDRLSAAGYTRVPAVATYAQNHTTAVAAAAGIAASAAALLAAVTVLATRRS